MGLLSSLVEENGETAVKAEIPVTRSDVLHACDIMEDVAVAYGINNIPKTLPKTSTVGGPSKINKLSDLVRRELALAGYTEVLPLTLVRKSCVTLTDHVVLLCGKLRKFAQKRPGQRSGGLVESENRRV